MNTDESIKQNVLRRKRLSKAEENILCIMAKKGYEIIPEHQELLQKGVIFKLQQKDAAELLAKYIGYGFELAPENHLALFDGEDAAETLQTYFRLWPLSKEAELKLFDFDPTNTLAIEYSLYHAFDEEAEIKFMTSAGCDEAQKSYVTHTALHTRTRNKLLKLNIGEQFIRQEMEERRVFRVSTQVLMLESQNAHEWMKRYTHYADLCDTAQMMLFEMHKPKKMVRLYESRRGLCDRARAKAIKMHWL